MKPIYAQRIREVRQKAGLNQTEFAEIIGTTKNQLSKYETSTQDTPTKVIISVCEKFDVDANWLMGVGELQVEPNWSKLSQYGIRTQRPDLGKYGVKAKVNVKDF